MAHALRIELPLIGLAPAFGLARRGAGRGGWTAARVDAESTAVSTLNGHRLTRAGSALYGNICLCCAATDAAGDQRLERPCPGDFG